MESVLEGGGGAGGVGNPRASVFLEIEGEHVAGKAITDEKNKRNPAAPL
jgi:hypothetical protein